MRFKLLEKLYEPTEKEIIEFIDKLSDEDDFSYLDYDAIAFDSTAILLTPSGEVINVGDYELHTTFLDTVGERMNASVPMYGYCIDTLGFITLNTGDGYYDDRCKVVIGEGPRPTQKQYSLLSDWLDKRVEEGKPIIVYCNKMQKTYYKDDWNYSSDGILKAIRRSYISNMLENKEQSSSSDYITLYHSTPYKNVKSIKENGLLVDKSESEKQSGYQMTWATTHPLLDDSYGGTIIKFRLPKSYDYEKANDDQYIIYQDIEPNLIDDIDIMIGDSGTAYMHQSELKDYINEYGKDKVKKVIEKHHSSQLTDEEVKQYTPELVW